MFVSDSYFGVIQAFETSGQFLYAIGAAGKAQVFETPVGMTSVGGDIVVIDMLGGSLKRLQLGSPQ